MPTISNLSFRVNFNLTGTPTLVLTDTTTSPPAGLVGIFTITQPDGYTRTGNINSPDISSAGGSFSYTLRLDGSGGLQCGNYTIVYSGNAPGYLSTDFTRTFTFQYTPVSLVMTQDFNVFTPDLKYSDDTVYTVSGYTNGAVTRSWTAVSTPTGTLTGSSQIFDLAYGGNYYSASYNVTLASSITYTNSVYNWLTISETITKNETACVEDPPSLSELVADISELRATMEELINTCQSFDQAKDDFEYAQSLLWHIIDKAKTQDWDNIYVDLERLLSVLDNYQTPTCNPTNAIIPPYDFSALLPGMSWGNIFGTITDQTDLVNYIASQISNQKYAANVGNNSATSFALSHGLSSLDVEVEIFENATGETVYADVVRTSSSIVTVSFATAPTTNQYRVIIMK
jgi:hypothetical protein